MNIDAFDTQEYPDVEFGTNVGNIDTAEIVVSPKVETIASEAAIDHSLTLNISSLQQAGMRVENTETGYKIVCTKAMLSVAKVARIISSANDVDINYSDELEDNELIAISKKPLWALKEENGAFYIDRNF